MRFLIYAYLCLSLSVSANGEHLAGQSTVLLPETKIKQFIDEKASESTTYKAMQAIEVTDFKPHHFTTLLQDLRSGDLYDCVAEMFEDLHPQEYERWEL